MRSLHPQFSHLMYSLANEDCSRRAFIRFVVRWLFFNIARADVDGDAIQPQHPVRAISASLDRLLHVALVGRPCRRDVRDDRRDCAAPLSCGQPRKSGQAAIGAPGLCACARRVLHDVPTGRTADQQPGRCAGPLLIVIILSRRRGFPPTQAVLLAFAALLFITNAAFFVSHERTRRTPAKIGRQQ